MMMMKVEVESRKLIKPLTPTPPNLRGFKISIIDEMNTAMHVIRILYYPSINDGKAVVMNLEESLARILPAFYPLAGRYMKEKRMVDCNDEGAEFSVAQVLGCNLQTVINDPSVEPEQLNRLLPVEVSAVDEPRDPLLAVQVNRFVECGGVAIGICVSHRVFDNSSLATFMATWASAAKLGETSPPSIKPDFGMLTSFFPCENLPTLFGTGGPAATPIVGKRFLFDKSVISRLRDRVCNGPGWKSSARPPSRVSVVSAVLAQAFMRADRAKHHDSSGAGGGQYERCSLIVQMIDVRGRTIPPVPKHACGTWVSQSYVERNAEESLALEHDYPCLALEMREANVKMVEDCKRILLDKEFGKWNMVGSYIDAVKKVTNPGFNVVWITDLSKFGDYELDFGFGKPVWVSLANLPSHDFIVLMNTKDNDGIEAWVYLHKSDMPFFENEHRDIIRNIVKIDDFTIKAT